MLVDPHLDEIVRDDAHRKEAVCLSGLLERNVSLVNIVRIARALELTPSRLLAKVQ
jgi:hypothetical protein